jgi:ribosome maturation factor RimP
MVDIQDIAAAAGEELGRAPGGESRGLFLVEVKALAGDEFEIFIDSDALGDDGRPKGVSIEDCMALSRAIDARFDRETDDFSLTVSSAGIGQPLKVARQFRKLVGRQVEVVLTGGAKIIGVLEAAGFEGPGNDDEKNHPGATRHPSTGGEPGTASGSGSESITISYPEKKKAEGKKRPEIATVTKTFTMSEVKTVKEHIDFK